MFGGPGAYLAGGAAIPALESVIMGPPTGIFTNIVGAYIIPPAATMLYFEAVGGAGGGAAGGNGPGTLNGGGGGGGGGRTMKWLGAAALRAQYPTGIPYAVGFGGPGAPKNTTYGTQGANAPTGGFTFIGDFLVATPGNYYGSALAGGGGGATAAFGGSAGLGDTQGAVGGTGGVQWQFYLLGNPVIDGTGGNGGYPGFLLGANETLYVAQVQAAGGGGGGGGGGGVLNGVAYNGGNSGFAITSDPTPIMGSGGIVGGTLPTTAGAPAGVTTSTQGGGGGGAAALTGDAQAGANALRGSGSGGGGGGSGNGTSGGAGGNGGSGYLRIVAF